MRTRTVDADRDAPRASVRSFRRILTDARSVLQLPHVIPRLVASRSVWLILSAVCIAALTYSICDLQQYASIDLRNRVVGARALLLSIDPYNIEWRPGMPLELADLHQRYPGITRVTAAPPLLLLYAPFAELPYRTQQIIWWVLQWVALTTTIIVLARSFSNELDRKFFILLAIIFFVGSWFWRLHVERGQYYIFSVMLICIDLAALRNDSRRPLPIWLGIPSGVAVAIKPTNVILLPMLWFLGERRAALAASFAAAAMFAVSLYPSGPEVWWSFLSSIKLWGEYEITSSFEDKFFGPVQAVAPAIIEGIDFWRVLSIGPYGSEITPSTLISLLRTHWSIQLGQVISLLLFIAGPVGIWWLKRRGNVSRDTMLLFTTFLLAAIEFTRPVRWTYVDVTFLPVAAFLVSTLPRSRPFIMLAAFTCIFYLVPLESKWGVRTRHLLTIAVVCVTLTANAFPLGSVRARAAAPG
jgi:hypothetical protein